MTGLIGSAYQEALKALAEQVARAYREDCGSYQVAAGLIQGNTLIAITATFDNTGTECWAPLDLGAESWSDERRSAIEHDARLVLETRIEAERGAQQQVAEFMKGVLDAYR